MSSMREVATLPYTAVTQPPPAEWPPQGEWTYDDYARLPNDGWKYEVIRGELYMSPAPRPLHQQVSGNLTFELQRFVRAGDLGQILTAPIDVILPRNLGTPVQPDIRPWSSFRPNGGNWLSEFTVSRGDSGDFGAISLEFGAIDRNDDHAYMHNPVNSGRNDDQGQIFFSFARTIWAL